MTQHDLRHPTEIDRRAFLRLTTATVSAAVLAACTPGRPSAPARPAPLAPVPAGAGGTLRVPPLLEGVVQDGRRVVELVAQTGRTALVPAGPSDTWGFNGSYLGPTIRAARGEEVQVRVRNDLSEATTVHWHGMHLPAVADGGPHQMIPPGETWQPSWTVSQPAATLWYHPHPHGETETQVYRGMAGMFIVTDDDEAGLALPRTYGVDDIPLIVHDREFDDAGQLVETDRRGPGMLGSTVLVNSVVSPTLDVAAASTRFRILNASTARSYNIGFTDDRAFELIATDGGLLPAPVRATRTQLTPGERVEIVVHLTAGESATMRSFAQDLGDVVGTTGAEDEFDLMTLVAPAGLGAATAVPSALIPIVRDDPGTAVSTRSFEMRADRINDELMDMARVDEVVTVDQLEVWEILNTTRTAHNFHIHGVQFQVADLDGTPPAPHLAGWKDTVYLPPGVRVRLTMRFTENTDPTTPYMYHCHLLWHEDSGMMGQFVVVRPGEEPSLGAGGLPAEHQH